MSPRRTIMSTEIKELKEKIQRARDNGDQDLVTALEFLLVIKDKREGPGYKVSRQNKGRSNLSTVSIRKSGIRFNAVAAKSFTAKRVDVYVGTKNIAVLPNDKGEFNVYRNKTGMSITGTLLLEKISKWMDKVFPIIMEGDNIIINTEV
jgi:hypothetical protein